MTARKQRNRQKVSVVTCGDAGGRTAKGEPCGVTVVSGRCHHHEAGADERTAEQKALFLKLYEAGDLSMAAASTQAEASRTTVWRWRRDDPEFDQAVAVLTDRIDDQRVHQVEETMFDRIIAGKASAAETIFFLINRGRGRWQHVQKVGIDLTLETLARVTEQMGVSVARHCRDPAALAAIQREWGEIQVDRADPPGRA
jgi:hypothetical protein